MFALAFRLLLLRTMAIGAAVRTLKDSTLRQYHGDFGPSLNRGPVHTRYAGGPRLFNAIGRAGDNPFRSFTSFGDGPHINIASAHRVHTVVFREVTRFVRFRSCVC